MDCNKEEAVRAKRLAEKKMEKKDFVTARRLILKAQLLCPDLESISQMRLVCDVICSAENKVYGNENLWYSILHIEPTADEASIRNHYCKFALSLHPDKNKFPGASDAFKLITEAKNVLLDSGKRKLYDSKLKATGVYPATKWEKQQAGMQANAQGQPPHQDNLRNNAGSQFPNQQHQKQRHRFVNNQSTFWTVCTFCSVKYEYYKEVINKKLVCQTCKNYFIASDVNDPTKTNSRHQSFQSRESMSRDTSGVVPQSIEKSDSKMETESNVGQENHTDLKIVFTSQADEGFNPSEESEKEDSRIKEPGQSGKPNSSSSKKRKTSVEGGESCEIWSCSDSEDLIIENVDNVVPKISNCNSDLQPQRSSRPREHVSHYTDLRLDDSQSASKRSKPNGLFHGTEEDIDMRGTNKGGCFVDVEEYEKQVRGKHGFSDEKDTQNGDKDAAKAYEKMDGPEDDKETSVSPESRSSTTNPEGCRYRDPKLSKFDNDQKELSFEEGQIWALHDSFDAMPRCYAVINKICSPGFKLQITRLEPDPDDEEEIKWVENGLPASCGKFRFGNTEFTEDEFMFSHLVSWEKGSKHDTYIHPRKGETWALFKDWDINWHSDPEAKKKYEYEFVEVLSDYADGVGVYVAFLAKLKGFSCLFTWRTRKAMNLVLIPAKAMFRFSHRVPSTQLKEKEREDVPEESFELDPACLPATGVGTSISEDLDIQTGEMHTCGSCSKSVRNMAETKAKADGNTTEMETAEANANSDGQASIVGLMGINAKYEGNEPLHDMVKQKEESAKKLSMDDMVKLKPEFVGRTSLEDMMQPMRDMGNNSTREESSDCVVEDWLNLPSSSDEFYEVPEPEFYDFDLDKSPDKFEIGQIWAIYCDEDALPKYYGYIKQIDRNPVFQLHVTWLEACPPPKHMVSWLNNEMLICCGKFKFMKGRPQIYTDTNSFSHLVRTERTRKLNVFAILPRKGEVWALYRNWDAGMRVADLDNCKYDIVEVVEDNDSGITVLVLEPVDSFKSVFRPQTRGESSVTRQISQAELLRFSHQIPSFQLTEERGGSLHGFWELDSAALPSNF